ncbi:hypothetical protein KSC_059790 [Ktedonobacter sp. SOSP1-52]|nr:hypothetical protein KSC_059790 [Ktedonobacter sp. SOSP1-52]
MDIEKAREQVATRCSQVQALTALELREIGLADARVKLFLHRFNDFHLRHGAIITAQLAFDGAQVFDFFG